MTPVDAMLGLKSQPKRPQNKFHGWVGSDGDLCLLIGGVVPTVKSHSGTATRLS